VRGTQFNTNEIKREGVEKWYAEARNLGFGNVALQETQHDSKVRSSREFDATQFKVGNELLKAIEKTGQRA